MDNLRKEQRILVVMRKVLANIVKDTTPPSKDMRHPLSEDTIRDIRDAFSLISAREHEITDQLGLNSSRPKYVDEPQDKVVPLHSISRNKKKTDD